jgi:hypothetical protein
MTSKTCAATIQEGTRKGQPCKFPAENDGYCGRHKRNKSYDDLQAAGKNPCRFFFRGCDELLTEEGVTACATCRQKKNKTGAKCKHEGCSYKPKENEYCGKHQRDVFRETEVIQHIRYCDIDRGCMNLCEDGFASCIGCLATQREKENAIYSKRKEQNKTQEYGTDLTCCYCGASFPFALTRFSRPRQSCDTCLSSQKKADDKRIDRVRNFKAEKFKNIERLYTEYVRNAVLKGRTFKLTLDQVTKLVTSPCAYCHTFTEGEVIGIDRVNNNRGYIKSNVVPACANCNYMKHTYDKAFFIAHSKSIVTGRWDETQMGRWSNNYKTVHRSYSTYICVSADQRNLAWDLSEEDYHTIKSKPCYICGYNKTKVGIDRYDPSIGYTRENSHPCCFPCNLMKSDMTYVGFIAHVTQIVEAQN